MKKHADLLGFLKTERICLKVAGLYPIRTNKYKHLHSMSAAFFLALTVLYVVFASIHAYSNLANVTELSEIVTFLMTILAYIVKMLNLLYYKKNLLLLEDMLQNPILTELETLEEENLLKTNLKYSRFFINIYKLHAITAASVHAVYPLIDSGSKNFLFLLWLPFNPENHYVTVYFFEAILLFSSTWFDITLDILNILMIDLCAIQFELLKNRLKRISSILSGDAVVDNHLRVQKLKKYIVHHDFIYSCSDLVRTTYSIGEFSQVVCSVIVVCFGLFKMIVTPVKSMQFMMLTTYSCTMIYQVSLYCCYGQKLLNASSTVAEACYMSQWINCSTKVQQYMIMIMHRANTPFLMKAGGIFTLTLETLMRIYTSSYSFFAIIWQVYNTEE